MEFSYREEQQSLRQLAAQILGDRFTDDFRREFSRSGEPYDRQLWATLAQAGLLGTAIGEEHGGTGPGLTELCFLLEEQGRTLAAVPLLATLVLGALPVQKFGSAAQCAALLPRVVSGEALPPSLRAELDGRGWERPDHGGVVCHCERVTRGEIEAAMRPEPGAEIQRLAGSRLREIGFAENASAQIPAAQQQQRQQQQFQQVATIHLAPSPWIPSS